MFSRNNYFVPAIVPPEDYGASLIQAGSEALLTLEDLSKLQSECHFRKPLSNGRISPDGITKYAAAALP